MTSDGTYDSDGWNEVPWPSIENRSAKGNQIDSRDVIRARRCQSHNQLMEPLAQIEVRVAGYYCLPCGAVQLQVP